MTGTWRIDTISRADGSTPSFLYVLTITDAKGNAVAWRTKDTWPAPTGSLYMERYRPAEGRDTLTLLEQFPLLLLDTVHGKRTTKGKVATTINLAIDRPSKKHCSILVMQEYRGDVRTKETVFLRTEASTKSHRSRFYLQPKSLQVSREVLVDTREQRPWAFDADRITRTALRCGDYALRIDEKIIAVIERKTFLNMQSMLTNLASYHTHLGELATHQHRALVVEAHYADFLYPKKLSTQSATRCAEAIAELHARHPGVQVVFAGNRKGANVWAAQFFASCAAIAMGTRPDGPVQETLVDDHGRANTGGLDSDLRHAIMHTLPSPIRVGDVIEAFPSVAKSRISNCLKALRDEGKLRTSGHGRGTTWLRIEKAGGAS